MQRTWPLSMPICNHKCLINSMKLVPKNHRKHYTVFCFCLRRKRRPFLHSTDKNCKRCNSNRTFLEFYGAQYGFVLDDRPVQSIVAKRERKKKRMFFVLWSNDVINESVVEQEFIQIETFHVYQQQPIQLEM